MPRHGKERQRQLPSWVGGAFIAYILHKGKYAAAEPEPEAVAVTAGKQKRKRPGTAQKSNKTNLEFYSRQGARSKRRQRHRRSNQRTAYVRQCPPRLLHLIPIRVLAILVLLLVLVLDQKDASTCSLNCQQCASVMGDARQGVRVFGGPGVYMLWKQTD